MFLNYVKRFIYLFVFYLHTCMLPRWTLQHTDAHAGRHHMPLVEYIIVPALPRDASVEWQVTAATDISSWQGLLRVLSTQLHLYL